MKLSEYKEDGQNGTERALVKSIEEKDGANGKYHRITITDGESDISANAFRLSEREANLTGKVCDVVIAVKNGYVNFNHIQEVEGADCSPYVKHAVSNPDAVFDWMLKLLEGVKNENLRKVASYLLTENKTVFTTMAAGRRMHHDCLNGLLYHEARMLSMVDMLVKTYNLNRDLMTAGVLLHDIGKLQEMETDSIGQSKYTTVGNLFGHLYLGPVMIDDACRELGIDRDDEAVMLLKHMLVSHHKNPETGAIKPPAFAEAYALSVLDDFDARIWMYNKAEEPLAPGETATTKGIGIDAFVYKRKEI